MGGKARLPRAELELSSPIFLANGKTLRAELARFFSSTHILKIWNEQPSKTGERTSTTSFTDLSGHTLVNYKHLSMVATLQRSSRGTMPVQTRSMTAAEREEREPQARTPAAPKANQRQARATAKPRDPRRHAPGAKQEYDSDEDMEVEYGSELVPLAETGVAAVKHAGATSTYVQPVQALLTGIVDRFWLRTEHLAVQNAQLQTQHSRAEADAAALRSAVQSTESGVKQLAQHQDSTANQIRSELQGARDDLHQHLIALAQDQSLANKSIDGRLHVAQLAFEAAQQEALAARNIAADQANSARIMRDEMAEALTDSLNGFSARVGEIERRLGQASLHDQMRQAADDAVAAKVEQLGRVPVAESMSEDQLEQRIQEALARATASAREGVRIDVERRDGAQFRKVKQLVVETNADTESRLEAKIKATLVASRAELLGAAEQQRAATESIAGGLRKTNEMCYGLAERIAALERNQASRATAIESSHPVGQQFDRDDDADDPEQDSDRSLEDEDFIPVDAATNVANGKSNPAAITAALKDSVQEAVESFRDAIQVHIRRGEQRMARSEHRLQLRAREIEAATRADARVAPLRRVPLRLNLSRVINQEQREVARRAEAAAQLHQERRRAQKQ